MSMTDIPVKRGRGRPRKLVVGTSPVAPAPDVEKLKQINVLLKDSGSLFDTLDINEYRQKLENLTLNELYNEALRIGLKSGADRSNCTRAILEVFTDYRNKFMPNVAGIPTKDNLSDDKRAKLLELMRDGK